jgi:hypothetical protein
MRTPEWTRQNYGAEEAVQGHCCEETLCLGRHRRTSVNGSRHGSQHTATTLTARTTTANEREIYCGFYTGTSRDCV